MVLLLHRSYWICNVYRRETIVATTPNLSAVALRNIALLFLLFEGNTDKVIPEVLFGRLAFLGKALDLDKLLLPRDEVLVSNIAV